MSSVNKAIIDLVTEVIQGTPPGASGTWFVQGDEALEATLADLTAEQASVNLVAGLSSIAAHAIHASYYLELALDGMQGISRDGDWEGSWAKQKVTDLEWDAARQGLKARADAFCQALREIDLEKNQDDLTYAMANLGHLAYHLGSIQQLYLAVKAR